jgi:hypothetical protein
LTRGAETAEAHDGPGATDGAPERCTACGAERERAEEANEEVTHREWCGAEYPVPDER